MSVRVICQCGTSYEVEDEFAGRLVKCPQCRRENRAPAAGAPPGARVNARDPGAAGDPFDRDVFLLRQQLLKISEKYDVCDEQGQKIIFVERPAHFLRNLGAVLAAIVVLAVILVGGLTLSDALKGTAFEVVVGIAAVVGSLVGAAAVGIALSAKRHVTFYRDKTKRVKLLDILQDKKFQPITATYTVRDDRGKVIALLWKNYLYNIFRKRWYVKGPDGTVRFLAMEDSILLSLLRRFLGPMLGLLRTNFIIVREGTDDAIGEFNRKLTIFDRYALDMKADPQRTLDRRVALALGVMLDTGERR